MGVDYYAILDVKRDASIREIKLAYRKLALRLHPLRKEYQQHTDPRPEGVFDLPLPALKNDVYWEILNEAYDVLSNNLWRYIYDLCGEEGLKGGTITPAGYTPPYSYHKDCSRTYFEFFGTHSPYADLIDAMTNPPSLYYVDNSIGAFHQDPDVRKILHISLEDVYNGGMKTFKYTRKELVHRDKLVERDNEVTLAISIPPGCVEGTEIIYPRQGDQAITRKPANIVFVTCEKRHPTYRRDNANLHMTHKISLKEALTGFKICINTLDNRKLNVAITDVVSPHYRKRLKNEGLPEVKNPKIRGDLIIDFEITFPKHIPKSLREKIERVFDEIETLESAREKCFENKCTHSEF